MGLWTTGILLVLGLAWFIGTVAVPFWQVRAEVNTYKLRFRELPSPSAVDRLGGPDRAIPKLALYLRLPERVAGDKWVVLHLLGHCNKDAVPLLLDAAHRDPRARPIVAFCLGGMGGKAREAVPFLLAALEDADAETRANAADSLAEVLWELEPECFMSELTGILAKGGPDSRRLACIVFGKLREKAAPAIPALEKARLDKDEGVRIVAAEALKRIRDEQAGK
jgi:hypothetical protein